MHGPDKDANDIIITLVIAIDLCSNSNCISTGQVQGHSLQCAMSFFFLSKKKRFTIEDCDWSHLKEFQLRP